MLRAFKTPAKGIGEKAIIEFDEYCGLVVNYVQKYRPGLNRPNPLDILLSLLEENEALWGPEAPLPTDTISTRPLKLFKTFAQQMKELRDKAYTEPLDKVINHVVPHFGLFPHLDKISKTTAEYEERRANVRELQSAAQKYAAQGPCLIDPKSTVHTEVELESPLGNYLDDVALVTDMADQGRESQDKRFKVCLMTIHASKGMEFDTVYVVGNEDGTFPTSQSITEGEGSVVLEEEKRLCYVAMTRAKTELILTWRKEVPIFTNAGIKRVEKKRSRFLNVLVSKNDKGARNSKRTSPPKKAKKKTAQPSMVGTNSIFSRKNDEKQFNDRGSSMNNMRRSVSSSARHSRPETARHSTLPSKSSYAAPKRSTSRHREEREPPGRQETRRNGTRSVFSQRNPGTTKGTASSPGRTTNLPPLQSSRQPPSLHQTTATSSAIPKQPEMDSTWFFPVGSKVKHTKFGQGIVLPPPPPRSKGDMPVVVEFPDGARREFSAHGTDLSPIFS
jgi:ATP-dependent exoDNAse (exonuclease V) beta subunit